VQGFSRTQTNSSKTFVNMKSEEEFLEYLKESGQLIPLLLKWRHWKTEKYRYSREEHDDVLKYYTMHRGNWAHVIECVIYSTDKDIGRFKGMVEEAIANGEIKPMGMDKTRAVIEKAKSATLKRGRSSGEDDGYGRTRVVITPKDSESS